MIFVEPSVQPFNETDLQKKVERCFRICYKSEDKMKETSDEFLTGLLNKPGNKHYSPLEHARIKLKVDGRIAGCIEDWQAKKHSRHIDIDYYHKEQSGNYIILVTGNLRSFREYIDDYNPCFNRYNSQEADIAVSQYAVSKTLHEIVPSIIPMIDFPDDVIPTTKEFKLVCYYLGEDENYQTFRIVTSRDILQQLARHRTLSPSVESTRFNNYNKKGFEFCIPRPYKWAEIDWNIVNTYSHGTIDLNSPVAESVINAAYQGEQNYDRLISASCKPQEARMVLPGCLKTELFLTGTFEQWKHFIQLRGEANVDPQCNFLAKLIKMSLDENHPGWDK